MKNDAAVHLQPPNVSQRDHVRMVTLLPERRRKWPAKIFRPLPAVYTWRSGEFDEEENIARLFYDKCYKKPLIHNSPSPQDAARVLLKSQQLLDRILLPVGTRHRNRFSYLVGQVGTGKSAYLNYILTRYGDDLFNNQSVWFLRVDLEKTYNLTGPHRVTRGTLLVKVVSKVLELFDRFPGFSDERPAIEQNISQLRAVWLTATSEFQKDASSNEDSAHYSEREGIRPTPAEQATIEKHESTWYSAALEVEFKRFVVAYRTATKRRLLLILDNADVVIHLDDREVFAPAGRQSVAQNIQGLVDFLHQFAFGDGSMDALEASVLTVMRDDTFQILNFPSGVSFTRLPESALDNVFSFSPVKWEDVFQSRMELAQKVADEFAPGTRSELHQLIERMNTTFRGGSPEHRTEQGSIIDVLKDISSFGNRGLISYFSHFAELHPQYAGGGTSRLELAARYRTTALISFFLRNNMWFSQESSQFPNLYLVNIPDGPCKQHRPSYWLKRLILEMLMNSRHIRIDPDVILHTFAGSGGTEYYERSLVEIALGSMVDVQRSNLLAIDWARSPGNKAGVYPEGVQLRPRAIRCMAEIFDSFTYLQVVVDDKFLHFPASIVEKFCWKKTDPSYAYFIADDPLKFSEGARAMIKDKERKVMIFLVILEEALSLEEKHFAGAFMQLAKRRIALPSVEAIRANVLLHIARLHRHFKMGSTNGLVADAAKLRQTIREDLEKAFTA